MEVDGVPDELSLGLTTSASAGAAIYNNDQMQMPVLDVEDGSNFYYSGAGYTIPGAHLRAEADSDEINAGVWSFPLKNSKDQFGFSIRFLGKDSKG